MNQLICAALTLLVSLTAFAHGEDKLGPHGGFIQMPGAYHTELVPEGTHTLKVYFLDISWKPQAPNESSVSISYAGKKTLQATCESQETHFACTFPPEVDLGKKGKLVVTSQHEKQKGNEVTYKLPLKLQSENAGHGGAHH